MNAVKIGPVLLIALLANNALIPGVLAEGAVEVKVSGPITGGEHGIPFSAPTVDLEDHGYVAEEFFLDGEASAYRMAPGSERSPDGRWRTEREEEQVPYRTRILVVRPAKGDRFNGPSSCTGPM